MALCHNCRIIHWGVKHLLYVMSTLSGGDLSHFNVVTLGERRVTCCWFRRLLTRASLFRCLILNLSKELSGLDISNKGTLEWWTFQAIVQRSQCYWNVCTVAWEKEETWSRLAAADRASVDGQRNRDKPEIRSNSSASPSISILAEERQQNLIPPEGDNSANETINPSESHSYLSSLERWIK